MTELKELGAKLKSRKHAPWIGPISENSDLPEEGSESHDTLLLILFPHHPTVLGENPIDSSDPYPRSVQPGFYSGFSPQKALIRFSLNLH